MATMVRVTAKTHESLRQLAEDVREPMREVVAIAVERLRRQRMLEATNAAYAALRADPQAWAEIEAERALWETTLMDGLDADEPTEAW